LLPVDTTLIYAPTVTEPPPSPATPEFWNQRYDNGAPWDLGQAAPALAQLIEEGLAPEPTIVLGCGYGHEALLFARAGCAVTGVDFSDQAIAGAKSMAKAAVKDGRLATGTKIKWLNQDMFSLLPKQRGKFGYVVEHSCFCAIDPSQRSAYVDLVAGLIKPGGLLLGVFRIHDRPDGPPFGSTEAEIRGLFGWQFEVVRFDNVESIEQRKGEERLVVLRRV
jgi:methyl halide transferase